MSCICDFLSFFLPVGKEDLLAPLDISSVSLLKAKATDSLIFPASSPYLMNPPSSWLKESTDPPHPFPKLLPDPHIQFKTNKQQQTHKQQNMKAQNKSE